MKGQKRIACVIPARLNSMRFPRKVLSMLNGKPLLQHIWEAASQVELFDEVGFAIDSPEVANLIDGFKGKWWMTSSDCPSGSDRLAELAQAGKVEADIWVNWQGDEPFIHQAMIEELLQDCEKGESDIWTLKKRIVKEADFLTDQIAKVVCDERGSALYFSRSPIPCYRDAVPFSQKEIYKHVGIYAYTSAALKRISTLKSCFLEDAEKLEQLRFLYHGLKIRVHETESEVFGIDLPEHLERAETLCRT